MIICNDYVKLLLDCPLDFVVLPTQCNRGRAYGKRCVRSIEEREIKLWKPSLVWLPSSQFPRTSCKKIADSAANADSVQSDEDSARSAQIQGRGRSCRLFFFFIWQINLWNLFHHLFDFNVIEHIVLVSTLLHKSFYFISTRSISVAQCNVQSNVHILEA